MRCCSPPPARPGNKAGLALALGAFDLAKIAAAAQSAGAGVETYGGGRHRRRPTAPERLRIPGFHAGGGGRPGECQGRHRPPRRRAHHPRRAGRSSQPVEFTQDAWVISTVPPSTLKPPAAAQQALGAGLQNALQKIVSASGGVKFGAMVVVTGQAQADTPQDASTLGGVLQLL